MRYAKCEIFIDRGGKRPPIAFSRFLIIFSKKEITKNSQ